MIYPEFPRKGDLIGICAPSMGVGYKLDSFNTSLDAIRHLGYEISETASVRADAIRSAEPEVRGAELNSLFADNTVKAVISAAGGDFAFDMLPYVDWELIRNNPKWFAGSSDPTNLTYAITTKCDISTIYGYNAGSFDWSPLHEFQKNALSIMQGKIPVQLSYPFYDGSKTFSDDVKMDTPVKWELYMPSSEISISSLSVTGRLIGGCIECIDNLLGTEFEDTLGFIERYHTDGIIWYFDIYCMDPMNLFLKMLKLKYMGYFAHARAIVFGRVMFNGSHTDADYLAELRRVFTDIPFIWNADIGHTKPSMTLINGSLATVKCCDGRGSIEMNLV